MKINGISPSYQFNSQNRNKINANRRSKYHTNNTFKSLPAEVLKANYAQNFGWYREVGDVELKDRETGKDVRGIIKKDSFLGSVVSYKVFVKNKEAGYIDVYFSSLFPDDEYLIPEPDDVIPHVKRLRSILGDKYEGIGSSLIALAVNESKKKGNKGALWLIAKKGFDSASSKYRSNENPIPFYYKLGFRSFNPEVDKYITECIAEKKYDKLPETAVLLLTSKAANSKNKYLTKDFGRK